MQVIPLTLASCALLLLATATPAADLDRALATRDLAPVRAWIEDLDEGEAATAATLRARAWLHFLDQWNAGAATEMMRQAVAEDPTDPVLLTDLAELRLTELEGAGVRAAMSLGRELRELYEQALELDPEHVPALLGLIGYHWTVPRIAGGRRSVAAEMMSRLAEASPHHWHSLRAGELRAEKKREAAIVEYHLAIDREDTPVFGNRFMLAITYHDAKRWDDAFAVLEVLVVEFPLRADAWYQLGRSSALSGQQADRGLEAFDHFLKMKRWPGDPSEAAAWWRIGQIHQAAGELDAARTAFKRALELNPDLQQASEALKQVQDG